MNDYGRNNAGRKKGSFPRKSEREFESFLPESMRTPAMFSKGDKFTNDNPQHYRKNHYNQAHGYGGAAYGDMERGSHSEKRGRGGYRYADWAESKLYDDRSSSASSGFKYAQPREQTGAGVTILGSKSRSYSVAPKIGTETFQSSANAAPPGRMVIARRDGAAKEKEREKVTILKPNSNGLSSGITPMILSRSKVDASVAKSLPLSSSMAVMSSTSQKILSSNVPYKIATKPPMAVAHSFKNSLGKKMVRPFRFIDDDFNLCDGYNAFNAYLLDQPHFLVVGVVGLQGAGKSTIANLLVSSCSADKLSSCFVTASRDQVIGCSHTTTGLDMFVSSQRIIVLDFPPLLSPGVMDNTTARDSKSHYQQLTLDEQVELKALQWLSLAIKVCHVIVVAQDSVTASVQVLDRLQIASSLHNTKPLEAQLLQHRDSGVVPAFDVPLEYYYFDEDDEGEVTTRLLPSVLLVQNKADPDRSLHDLTADIEAEMYVPLSECELLFGTGVGRTAPAGQLNLFCLPRRDSKNVTSSEARSIRELRAAVMGVDKRVFSAIPYTEKTWFEYVVREWEKIRKSRLYLDYSRLCP